MSDKELFGTDELEGAEDLILGIAGIGETQIEGAADDFGRIARKAGVNLNRMQARRIVKRQLARIAPKTLNSTQSALWNKIQDVPQTTRNEIGKTTKAGDGYLFFRKPIGTGTNIQRLVETKDNKVVGIKNFNADRLDKGNNFLMVRVAIRLGLERAAAAITTPDPSRAEYFQVIDPALLAAVPTLAAFLNGDFAMGLAGKLLYASPLAVHFNADIFPTSDRVGHAFKELKMPKMIVEDTAITAQLDTPPTVALPAVNPSNPLEFWAWHVEFFAEGAWIAPNNA